MRRVALRHAAQVFAYMGHYWQLVENGSVDSFQAAVVYPKRPKLPGIEELVTDLLGEDGIAVYWYEGFLTDQGHPVSAE